ncbi:uncharacterized protein [Maniola hyperantus]|uniref:uncharacterized protein n=1 Tax=Aphantopus hyperantus TaxID=2795564 RepID=UPI00374812BF
MADGATTTMQGDMCGVEFKMPRGIDLEDLDTCWQQWQKFKDSFKIFMLAAGFEKLSEPRKAALLLNCIGSSALELYLNVLKKEDKPKLEEVIKLFDEYFKPKSNEVMASYNFNRRVQQDGENFDTFYSDLRKLADSCNFGQQKDRMLRDRLVIGVKQTRVQQKLLEIKDLTLDKALDICRSAELSSQQLMVLHSSEVNAVAAASTTRQLTTPASNNSKAKYSRPHNNINNKKNCQNNYKNNLNKNNYQCKKCNKVHGPRQCPAFGKTCLKCGKLNHFSVGCMSKNQKLDNINNIHDL